MAGTGYENDVRKVRCALCVRVRALTAIPISCTTPSLTFNTAVAPGTGARYQSLAPITNTAPSFSACSAAATVVPGRMPSIAYWALAVEIQITHDRQCLEQLRRRVADADADRREAEEILVLLALLGAHRERLVNLSAVSPSFTGPTADPATLPVALCDAPPSRYGTAKLPSVSGLEPDKY